MSRIASMLVCSSLGMVMGAGVALAYTPPATGWLAGITDARKSLQEAVDHLQSAQRAQPNDVAKTALRKAISYIDLATAELDGVQPPIRKLTN